MLYNFCCNISERLTIFGYATCSTQAACTLHTRTRAISRHCSSVLVGDKRRKNSQPDSGAPPPLSASWDWIKFKMGKLLAPEMQLSLFLLRLLFHRNKLPRTTPSETRRERRAAHVLNLGWCGWFILWRLFAVERDEISLVAYQPRAASAHADF